MISVYLLLDLSFMRNDKTQQFIEKGLQSSERWIATLYVFLCN